MKRSKIVDDGRGAHVRVAREGEGVQAAFSLTTVAVARTMPSNRRCRKIEHARPALHHMVRHSDLELDRTARRIVMGEPLLFRAT